MFVFLQIHPLHIVSTFLSKVSFQNWSVSALAFLFSVLFSPLQLRVHPRCFFFYFLGPSFLYVFLQPMSQSMECIFGCFYNITYKHLPVVRIHPGTKNMSVFIPSLFTVSICHLQNTWLASFHRQVVSYKDKVLHSKSYWQFEFAMWNKGWHRNHRLDDKENFTDCWKSFSLTYKVLPQSGMFVVNVQHAAIKCAKQCLMLALKTCLL